MEIKIRQGVASDAAQTTPLILNAAQSLLTSIFGQNKNKQLRATCLMHGNSVAGNMALRIIGWRVAVTKYSVL